MKVGLGFDYPRGARRAKRPQLRFWVPEHSHNTSTGIIFSIPCHLGPLWPSDIANERLGFDYPRGARSAKARPPLVGSRALSDHCHIITTCMIGSIPCHLGLGNPLKPQTSHRPAVSHHERLAVILEGRCLRLSERWWSFLIFGGPQVSFLKPSESSARPED